MLFHLSCHWTTLEVLPYYPTPSSLIALILFIINSRDHRSVKLLIKSDSFDQKCKLSPSKWQDRGAKHVFIIVVRMHLRSVGTKISWTVRAQTHLINHLQSVRFYTPLNLANKWIPAKVLDERRYFFWNRDPPFCLHFLISNYESNSMDVFVF